MPNIILISYTPLDAPGGVPRWNRDFVRGFPEARHYSWWDCPLSKLEEEATEWDKAATLNAWLRKFGKIDRNDIVIVDGFWGKGLEDFPNVVSVCHGIWSHLIKEEADAGMPADFPIHHAIQVGYRAGHLKRGGRLVAVSKFIQHQMKEQWGFKSEVINNAIDLDEYRPMNDGQREQRPRIIGNRPLILHGVNDPNNPVKGGDHVLYVREKLMDKVNIMSLDQAHNVIWSSPIQVPKQDTLKRADAVLIPSAYEGNSYFLLEALACDVPIVAYDIGLVFELDRDIEHKAGVYLDRSKRSPEVTLEGMQFLLKMMETWKRPHPRNIAKRYSIDRFHEQWRKYLEREFGYDGPR